MNGSERVGSAETGGASVMRTPRSGQAAMGAALGAVVAANLFFFMPLTLYVGNSGELTVSFTEVLGLYLPFSVGLVAVAALMALLVPRRPYLLGRSLLATVSILIWVQGNLLVWDYGLLDGRTIDWSAGAWRGWVDGAIWAVAVVAAAVGYRRVGVHVVRVAFVVFALQSSIFVYQWVSGTTAPAVASGAGAENAASEVHRFSADRNIVHIVADGFQSDIFEEIAGEGAFGERLRSALEGFTFFREHLGLYPFTHMTLPAMLTGQVYRNQEPAGEFMASTLGGRSILGVAADAGYTVDLVVPEGALATAYSQAPHTHLHRVTNQQHSSRESLRVGDATRLFDMTLFRVSPHFVKKHVYNDQLWLVQSLLAGEGYERLEFFSHTAFLGTLAARMTADRPEPVYKLIHLMLSHNPMVATEACGYAGRVLQTVRPNVKNQARCSLVQVVELLESMKRLGIYDEATIVLMGDHGAWVPPSRMQVIISPDGRSVEHMDHRVVALATPLFAVKRPGESGPLSLSEAPSWIVDTAATIAASADLEATFPGRSAFDLEPGVARDRSHLVYTYSLSAWSDEYLKPMQEYVVRGSAFDSAAWEHTATHLPGNVKEPGQGRGRYWVSAELDR